MKRFIGTAGLLIALFMAPGRAYAIPTTDGFWDFNNAEGYTLFKESAYESHGQPAGQNQGVLGIAVNGNDLYLMFAYQLSVVDNTYGTTQVGWPSGHAFKDLTGSDNMAFLINKDGKDASFSSDYKTLTIPTNTVFQAKIDYVSAVNKGSYTAYESLGSGGGDGSDIIPDAGPGALTAYATSLQWNLKWNGTTNTNNTCGQAITNSPDIDNTSNTNLATNANYLSNQTSPNCGTWLFPVIYEVKLSLSTLNLGTTDINTIRNMVDIYDGHLSPAKNKDSDIPDTEVCGDGVVGPNGSSTSVALGCSPGGNPPVPEPASLVLLGTGILGLGRAVRNRKRK